MADQIHSTKLQDKVERNVFVMFLMLAILLSVGGLVEIVPLFFLDNTMEHNKRPEIVWQRQAGQTLADWKAGDGVRPYTALELAGRDVYTREGCYLCHSQQIRPFRDEKERYGHYSLASESMYDHPFQWGSKRTGPDLARVGSKYSNEWHYQHLRAPRSVVPESVMPNYPWLDSNKVDGSRIASRMRAMKMLGVPYTEDDIATASAATGKSEMQAVVAYLQVLGTMVKFEEGVDYRE
ncbi:MAG: cytochrome-c oxidase, cbb3-type subunit II [Gammaproteobacteria bacterium HGW-Gammaproteobacteria-1]|jgi:cytochrome c oxidase cbb3-type subunit 2|nr:MAG: cytochrome-c oxidase, cbb3-type subunit II [Gammaproteobacteria bacterium HGW-Gammaproteobacteria-1]